MVVKETEEEKKKWELIVESKLVTRACPLSFSLSLSLSLSLCLSSLCPSTMREGTRKRTRQDQTSYVMLPPVLVESSSVAAEEGAGDVERLLCDITTCWMEQGRMRMAQSKEDVDSD